MTWELKRTRQCNKCPWRVDVNPHDIPNGYCETKHRHLESTIAKPGDLSFIGGGELHVMACHETDDAHCVGWLMNQLGHGNNIAMRFRMISCGNSNQLKVVGEQHEHFDDTLPANGVLQSLD